MPFSPTESMCSELNGYAVIGLYQYSPPHHARISNSHPQSDKKCPMAHLGKHSTYDYVTFAFESQTIKHDVCQHFEAKAHKHLEACNALSAGRYRVLTMNNIKGPRDVVRRLSTERLPLADIIPNNTLGIEAS